MLVEIATDLVLACAGEGPFDLRPAVERTLLAGELVSLRTLGAFTSGSKIYNVAHSASCILTTPGTRAVMLLRRQMCRYRGPLRI